MNSHLYTANQHSVSRHSCASVRRASSGFTLIELLVVIAIIVALAAMVAGGFKVAGRGRIESRVKVERDQLVNAIESYKKKFGFYPPDNFRAPNAYDPTRPPLYYELVGWTGTKDELNGVTNAFNVGGFVNSDSDRVNFLPNLKPKGYAALPSRSPQTFVLTVPAIGPAGEFNTWNYRSTRPENNTESFDLWAEVIISSKTNKIGNWKE
jgi:prepilin-type N-terminal cleavage/methylation domain-containing protein